MDLLFPRSAFYPLFFHQLENQPDVTTSSNRGGPRDASLKRFLISAETRARKNEGTEEGCPPSVAIDPVRPSVMRCGPVKSISKFRKLKREDRSTRGWDEGYEKGKRNGRPGESHPPS